MNLLKIICIMAISFISKNLPYEEETNSSKHQELSKISFKML